MTGQKFIRCLLAVCWFCWLSVFAAEQPSAVEADMALLDFLGSVEEDADEWEAFLELATESIPPMVAEVEHED